MIAQAYNFNLEYYAGDGIWLGETARRAMTMGDDAVASFRPLK
jgi:hypothetical protein